jgi:hypothetical protein
MFSSHYMIQRTTADGTVTYFNFDLAEYVVKASHASTLTLNYACKAYHALVNVYGGNEFAVVRSRSYAERYAIKRTSSEGDVAYFTGNGYDVDSERSVMFNMCTAVDICRSLTELDDGYTYEAVDGDDTDTVAYAGTYLIKRVDSRGNVDYVQGDSHTEKLYSATWFTFKEASQLCRELNRRSRECLWLVERADTDA